MLYAWNFKFSYKISFWYHLCASILGCLINEPTLKLILAFGSIYLNGNLNGVHQLFIDFFRSGKDTHCKIFHIFFLLAGCSTIVPFTSNSTTQSFSQETFQTTSSLHFPYQTKYGDNLYMVVAYESCGEIILNFSTTVFYVNLSDLS